MTVSVPKSRGERFQPWATSIAVLLTPIAVAVVGALYADRASLRSTQTALIQVAVGVLEAPLPDSQQAATGSVKQLRGWAVEVLNRYSEVQMSDTLQRSLRNVIPFPSIHWSSTGNAVSVSPLGTVHAIHVGVDTVRSCVGQSCAFVVITVRPTSAASMVPKPPE